MLVALALLGMALQQPQPQPQTPVTVTGRNPRIGAPTDSGVSATKVTTPPTIDGKGEDEAWRNVPGDHGLQAMAAHRGQGRRASGPRRRSPTTRRTSTSSCARSIRTRTASSSCSSGATRFTSSDMIWLFIDSYHDRRTGYEFGVNAAGVKIDQAIYDDGNEDGAWDARVGRRDAHRLARLDGRVPDSALADALRPRQGAHVRLHRSTATSIDTTSA